MAQNIHMLPVDIGNGNANCGSIAGSFNNYVSMSDVGASVELTFQPADPNTPEEVSGYESSVSNSADTIIPSIEPPSPSQPPSFGPPKFRDSPNQTTPHPNKAPSTLPITVSHCFIIASFIFIPASINTSHHGNQVELEIRIRHELQVLMSC